MAIASLILCVLLLRQLKLRRLLPLPRKPDGLPDWSAFLTSLQR